MIDSSCSEQARRLRERRRDPLKQCEDEPGRCRRTAALARADPVDDYIAAKMAEKSIPGLVLARNPRLTSPL